MSMRYAVVEYGQVINLIIWDGQSAFVSEGNQQLIDITSLSESPGIGWSYSDGVFTPPPEPVKTHDELVTSAEKEKSALLDTATTKIVVWQTKLLVGRKLTDRETAQLNSWLNYIDTVSAIDTSSAPDIIWPVPPSA